MIDRCPICWLPVVQTAELNRAAELELQDHRAPPELAELSALRRGMTGGCFRHTAAQRKAAEIDCAWEDHEWEDPSSARIRFESEREDLARGGYSRFYRPEYDD